MKDPQFIHTIHFPLYSTPPHRPENTSKSNVPVHLWQLRSYTPYCVHGYPSASSLTKSSEKKVPSCLSFFDAASHEKFSMSFPWGLTGGIKCVQFCRAQLYRQQAPPPHSPGGGQECRGSHTPISRAGGKRTQRRALCRTNLQNPSLGGWTPNLIFNVVPHLVPSRMAACLLHKNPF